LDVHTGSTGALFDPTQRTARPAARRADDFRRSLARVDPMLPILGALSTVGALLFALNTAGRPAALTGSRSRCSR